MICKACAEIPLDLFLPLSGKHSWFKDGKAWNRAMMLREGTDAVDKLAASAAAGCALCSIFQGALDRAEPLWAIQQFQGTGHLMLFNSHNHEKREDPDGIILTVKNPGEMVITDGERTAGVYWEMEELGYGIRKDTVNETANCENNLSMARNWLQKCSQQHERCAATSETVFLPTRLIYLNSSPDGTLNPRIIIPSNHHFAGAQHARYLALSYCRGADWWTYVPGTTKANLPLYLDHLDIPSPAKTFIDAIEIAHRLGFQYLWIDAYCIIQDDLDDFTRECSMMHLVYSRAYCTIVASDSPDVKGGCFLPRSVAKVQPCRLRLTNLNLPYYRSSIMDVIWGRFDNEPPDADVVIFPNFGPWIKSIQRGAVFTRGWCLQERELSPRVLHFTRDRLLWECRESTASEDELEMESKQTDENLATYLSRFRVLDDTRLFSNSNTKSGVQKKIHKWDRVVEDYSARRLYMPSDKLPALSGIAAAISSLNGGNDTYLAGIWMSNLLKGLSWFPVRKSVSSPLATENWPPVPVCQGIPSWSWASHDGPVTFHGEDWYTGSWSTIMDPDGNEKWVKVKAEIAVIEASTTPSTVDRFGRVSSGQVTLNGWVVGVTVSEEDVLEKAPENMPKCYSVEDSIPGMTVYFDVDVGTLPKNSQFACLQLGTGKSPRGTSHKADVGLVLRSSPTRDGAYERLGMFDVNPDRKERWLQVRRKMTVTII